MSNNFIKISTEPTRTSLYRFCSLWLFLINGMKFLTEVSDLWSGGLYVGKSIKIPDELESSNDFDRCCGSKFRFRWTFSMGGCRVSSALTCMPIVSSDFRSIFCVSSSYFLMLFDLITMGLSVLSSPRSLLPSLSDGSKLKIFEICSLRRGNNVFRAYFSARSKTSPSRYWKSWTVTNLPFSLLALLLFSSSDCCIVVVAVVFVPSSFSPRRSRNCSVEPLLSAVDELRSIWSSLLLLLLPMLSDRFSLMFISSSSSSLLVVCFFRPNIKTSPKFNSIVVSASFVSSAAAATVVMFCCCELIFIVGRHSCCDVVAFLSSGMMCRFDAAASALSRGLAVVVVDFFNNFFCAFTAILCSSSS